MRFACGDRILKNSIKFDVDDYNKKPQNNQDK